MKLNDSPKSTSQSHLNSVSADSPEATLGERQQSDLQPHTGGDLAKIEATPIPTPDAHPADPVEPTESKRPGLKKKYIFGAIAIGVLSLVGVSGLRWWSFANSHEETDNATITGNIYPISTRINGTVENVFVKENQQVQTGQALLKLDPRDAQAKIDRATAALETAKRQAAVIQTNIQLATQNAQASNTQAQGGISNSSAGISSAQAAVTEAQSGIPTAVAAVTQAKSGIVAANAVVAESQAAIPAAQAALAEAKSGVPAAQAQVAQFDATLIKTKADYLRYQKLVQSGAGTQQQLDTARATYQETIAKRSAAVQGIQQAKAKVAQAQEQIVAAKARLAQAQEGINKAKTQLTQAQAGVTRAKAQVAQAQDGVNRAKAQMTTSQGSVQQAKAVGVQTEVSKSQYQAALATVAQAQADLKEARLQLSYTNIVASSSGRVGNKRVQIGQQTQAGTPLMAIVDNNVWAIANFKETQLAKMHPGQAVEIKIDSFPKHPFIGKLESLSPASGAKFSLLPPDNATGNFTKVVQRIGVKVLFDPQSIKDYESRIAPGMSATVTVETEK
jgi:membrane fusion protein, multidrug efflux system